MNDQIFIWTIMIGLLTIIIVILSSPYRSRIATKKAETKIKNWIQERGVYTKEMYFADLDAIGISHDTGLAIAFFLNRDLLFKPAPPIYPKMDEELTAVWGLDDDIGDLVNHAFTKENIKQRIKWNDKRLHPLLNIRDLLIFIQNEIKENRNT